MLFTLYWPGGPACATDILSSVYLTAAVQTKIGTKTRWAGSPRNSYQNSVFFFFFFLLYHNLESVCQDVWSRCKIRLPNGKYQHLQNPFLLFAKHLPRSILGLQAKASVWPVPARVSEATEDAQMCLPGVWQVSVCSPHNRRSLREVCPTLQRSALEACKQQQRGAQPLSE